MPACRWFVLLCGVCFGIPPSLAQQPERYIERIFETRIGELPRMGWFTPHKQFLGKPGTANELYLFAPLGVRPSGQRNGFFSGSDVKRFGRNYQIACDAKDTDRFAAFDVDGETEHDRALYVTKKMKGELRSGLVTIPMNETQMAMVDRVLGWPRQGVLRRDEAIGVQAQSFYYSFHSLYDAKTGLLSQEAIVLHRKDGGVAGHKQTRNLDSGPLCDSCGIPNYLRPDSGLYRPLNMFEIPGFAYPVVLLDTSTFENRALSLLTFTPDGKVAEFRDSEYVVHCR